MDPFLISYLANVAGTLTKGLLEAAAPRLRKAIEGTPQEQALRQAVEDGLVALQLSVNCRSKEEIDLLADIFKDFFSQEDVVHDLADLLRGQLPDFAELRQLFGRSGFEAHRLAGLDFDQGMQAFVAAFLESADRLPALQEAIKTGLLRTQVGLSREMLATMKELIDFLRQEADRKLTFRGDTLIDPKGREYSLRLSPGLGNHNAERHYLRTVRGVCDTLDLINFDESKLGHGKGDHLKISQVFTGLQLQHLQYGPEDDLNALIRHKKQHGLEKQSDKEKLQPVSAIQAVTAMDRLVILGRPGSGKSTLVNHLVTQLAGHRAGEAGIDSLDGWQGGVLLPVRIVLRRFAVWPALSGKGTAGMVWNYMACMLEEMGCADAFTGIKNVLLNEGGIIFFDGLDEVPETVDQHKRSCMMEAIQAFSEPLETCKIIITCREYAYRANDTWRLPETVFPVVQLADLSDEQIREFAGGWYRAVGPLKMWSDRRCIEEAESLCLALDFLPRLKEMAGSPLLLTIMAQLHGRDGSLPRDRAELYRRAVLALLALWENRIVWDREGVRKRESSLVMQLGISVDTLQKAMAQVSFVAHERQQHEQGTEPEAADISRHDLLDILEKELGDLNKAREVVEYIEKRAGLLVAKGDQTYCFPHRTFQEYLAASHILSLSDYDIRLRDLVKEAPDWWREVFLLAASAANTPRVVSDLVDSLIPFFPAETSDIPAQGQIVCLAGLALAETDSAARVRKELTQSPQGGRFAVTHKKVQAWLESAMFETSIPVKGRAEAGRVLGKVGDPRPGVGLRPDGLPDIAWCDIADGPFLMGSTAQEAKFSNKGGQFSCSLIREPFQISRYPVTVAQFRAFVQAGGYEKEGERFWTEAGWQWRLKENINGPKIYREGFQIDNHPQVGVSWFEAVAFCNWLSSGSGEDINLPSEAQWERAARSTDGRIYPWGGGELDPVMHANIADTDIGSTSAGGLFPAGNAACGASDCAGNVWEWCRTIWLEDYADYERKVDNTLVGTKTRVLRGGAWGLDRENARCSIRLRYFPNFRYLYVGFRCARTPVAF